MFRRSRLSIRPNVSTTGRTSAVPPEAPSSNGKTQAETPVSVTDTKSTDATNEPNPGDSNDQHGEAACSSAIQRRKRFSVKPKVVPGRPSALPRTPKSPIKPVLPPVKNPAPVIDKATTSTDANSTAPLHEILPPKDCKLSNKGIVSPTDDTGKIQPCNKGKEIPPQAPVPLCIPDRETFEISEKVKTLVSKTDLSTSSKQFSLSHLLNDKSDLVRLEKARKLRQLLKEEMLKVKSRKSKARAKEHISTLDPSKMTMRDLIHYLPVANPMSSALEESQQENDTFIPQSPEREASPEKSQEPEVQPKILSPAHSETAAAAEEQNDEEEEAAEDEDAIMVPQVKVAEDGTLIIDEESLTVEVQRMKGPNTIQDRDPIFERGSTTTYSSFRKGTHTKPWSTEETDMFFLAISMVGTDFTMICQLFPHRARTEIKNKFKKEERHNAWRIDKAFRERRKLDLEYFKKLLEKILEFQQSKKKLKSISEKNKTPKKRKRNTKGKNSIPTLSDVEEESEVEISDEEQEGEKENLCNDRTSASKPKRKRKDKADLPPDPHADKKKNVPESTSEEAALPEDECEMIETPESTKKTEAKSGKTGKAPHLSGRRKTPKSKAFVSDKGETTSEETVEDQINKDTTSQKSTQQMSDNEFSDQEVTLSSSKPTRSGRISKPVQMLNYPAKEDKNSSSSDTTLTSPARPAPAAAKAKGKTPGKRRKSAQQQSAKESKKPKLITLRASQTDDESEEEEPEAQQYDDENSTSAFVPASLCSPKPVVQDVEETMEELDFLTHMPDVLGMSNDSLCPDASCEQVQNERGSVQPCEHQLDLLVDVIDFLSEHADTSEDEGYNEAAQTLLAIGKAANLSQPTESQASVSDHTSNIESSECTEVDAAESTLQLEKCTRATLQPPTTEVNPTVQPLSHTSDSQVITSSEEACSKQESLPPRKGRFLKIKPKPNLGSRTTKLRAQTVSAAVEINQDEVHAATTVQPPSAEQQESTEAVLEPSQTESRPTDNTTVMPSSHISNANVSLEPCSVQESDMSPQSTAALETDTSFSLSKEEIPLAIKEIKSDLMTTVETVLEKTLVYDDIATTNQLRSLAQQEQSSLPISEQSNVHNEATVRTMSEIPASQMSDTQDVKHRDDSCSSPGTTASECAAPSMPRKGRLSKIKPKPNIGCASRTTKLTLKSDVTYEEKTPSECEIAATVELQSATLSSSETACCRENPQESLNSRGRESDLSLETSQSQEQSESGSQSTHETHLEHFQEKPQDQLKPVIKSVTTIESGNKDSTQSDNYSEEVETGNTRPVQQSHPSSESSKLSTPQRRRWIPKVKPKLVLSSRTTKSDTPERSIKSSSVAAISEKQAPQENTQPSSSGLSTTNIKSGSVSELETRITEKTKALFLPDEPTIVGQPRESSAPFDSDKTVHQLLDSIPKKTDICQESRDSSNIHLATAEGSGQSSAEELSSTLQHNEVATVAPSDFSKVQDTSEPNIFECQNLFSSMVPEQVPSDPDEPFFILSLTEIPVCPSAEVVVEPQQRYPVEPVAPPAAGIDISLSNIHIPTPEKAALGSGLICVEEYLPSAPSRDISILSEPQEHPTVRRLTFPDALNNTNSNKVVKGTVDTTQDHSKTSAQLESCREMVENDNGKSRNESDDSSVISRKKRAPAETRGGKLQNRKTKATCEPPWEQNEIQSSGAPNSTIIPRSSSSNENLSICVSSEPLDTHQSDSTNLEEEPTNISECFFSDVFTEVQEIPGGSDGHVKTHKKPQRKTDTSCKLSRRQNNSQTEDSEIEEMSSSSLQENMIASSASVKTVEQEKEANVKGNRKNKVLSEAKVDRKGRKSAVKSPETFSRDHLKESTSSKCKSTSALLASRQSDSIESCPLEEEPTDVSQFFISDVFTEVESDDCTVTEKHNETTRTDKSQTAKNKRADSKIKASDDSSCGQQTPEVSRTKDATFPASGKTPSTSSVMETPSEPGQVDAKKTRRKGRPKKEQASCETLKSQRKCKEPVEALSLDVLNDSARSDRSTAHEQRGCLRGASEFAVSKTDAPESNAEPTNASQCLAVEALAATCSNKDDESATSDTRGKTRGKRKTKASTGSQFSQRNPLTEEQLPEASVANQTQKNIKSADLKQEATGRETSNRNNKSTIGAKTGGSRTPKSQCTSGIKSPKSLPRERIEENPSVEQQLPDHQNESKVSSDEEPTNVSQYFLSDVFTDVDEDLKT